MLQCGAAAEAGYTMPLCTFCRNNLSLWPFPKWLIAALVVVAAVLFYSISAVCRLS